MTDNSNNLEKMIAEDYKKILHEAKTMGYKNIGALYNIPFENMEAIIKALDDLQKYRELEDRLYAIFGDAISLQDVVDNLEYKLKEPGKQHPINAKILTYEDAAKWEQYKSIGTPEECRRAIEKQKTVSSFDNFDVRK